MRIPVNVTVVSFILRYALNTIYSMAVNIIYVSYPSSQPFINIYVNVYKTTSATSTAQFVPNIFFLSTL